MMANDVLTAIKTRSSARAYSSEKLTADELDSIVRAGLEAPTATNKQEIHFSVVSGDNPLLAELDDEMRRLRGMEKQGDNFFHGAPVLIVISAEDGFKWSAVDAGIAVENMALAAQSLGLGSLIIGCINDAMHGEKQEYFSRKLEIPDGYSFKIALAAGHKTDNKIPHEYEAAKQVSYI